MSESLIPAGKKATDLTVLELAYASRKIKVDVLSAMAEREDGGHPERGMALAYIALLWARRQNPSAKIEEFTSLTFNELMEKLATDTPDEDSEEPDDLNEAIAENPTESVPA